MNTLLSTESFLPLRRAAARLGVPAARSKLEGYAARLALVMHFIR